MVDIRPTGTIVCLGIMQKAMQPIDGVVLLWEMVFFVRIWHCWLSKNGHSEMIKFITRNAYTCIELNAHFHMNLCFNVINDVFPIEVLYI